MTAGLDVLGHLTFLAEGGQSLRVAFHGDVVALELPDLRAALALRRRFGRTGLRAWMHRLQAALARAGLELHVEVGGRRVGRLAAGTRPGRLSAWLGLDPMELTIRPVLALLARVRATPGRGEPPASDRTGGGITS